MTWKIISAPAVEPITLEDARLHLRVTPDDDSPPAHPDDTLIMALVSAAREYCERYLMRALAPQTVEVVFDGFPATEIPLPFSPIDSIVSVTYVDEDGVEQVMDDSLYVLDNDQEPGWLLPLIGTTWPGTLGAINTVRVRYDCGYTVLPASIRAAMLLLVGNWYENREAVIIGTIQNNLSFAVEALLLPYRLRLSMT